MDPAAVQQPALGMILLDLPVLMGTAELCLAQRGSSIALALAFLKHMVLLPVYTLIPDSQTLLSFALAFLGKAGPAAKIIPPINTAKLSVSAPFLKDYLHSYPADTCGARPSLNTLVIQSPGELPPSK